MRPLRDQDLERRLRESEDDSRRIYREGSAIGRRLDDVTHTIDDSDDGVIVLEIEPENSLVVHVQRLAKGRLPTQPGRR
jgi:hypothetical protein